jgi:hypothetical protein
MADYYYELRVSIVCAGNFSQCVFNYVIDLPTPPSDFEAATQLLQALDDGGAASWIEQLRDCLSEDAFISCVRARQVAPTGGNTVHIVFEPTDLPGTVVQPLSALQLAGCIIFVNGTDPDRTGRCFVPGVPVTFADGARWDATAIAEYEGFGNKHSGGLVVALGTFNAVIYDRVAKTGLIIDGCYLSPKIGTQRRRELPV